ncbi:MAG: LptF/LptG family permease [Candidatus Latescibacterota bacterium]
MSTFSRYVLREHLGPFVLGLGLIVFVLLIDVVLQMMDQVLSKGLSLLLAGQLLLYNLAWILALAVPMAVLIAAIMAFARLASDNEVMAAKACGVSFWQLVRPVLLAGLLLTVLMVWFNDRILPDSNHRARTVASSLTRRKAALALKEKEGMFIHGLGEYSLLVRHVDEEHNRLDGITVYDTRAASSPTALHAPRGSIHVYGDGSYMRLWLEDGEFLRPDPDDPRRYVRGSFQRQVVHIRDPERGLSRHTSTYRSDREMGIAAMRRAVADRRTEQQASARLVDSTLQVYLATLCAAGSDSASLAQVERQADSARLLIEQQRRLNVGRRQRIDEYLVEIHKKFSIPVACLVFVLVGAPLGVAVRRSGAAVSVGISLGFFWVYWMFLIGGEELADRGFVGPGTAMWAPNVLIGLVGGYLTLAASGDRPWLPRRLRRGG